tara:strand:+ start:191 stop:442 length:252 start_codon:yes stop_codon:yes gene_type:complete
MGYRDKQQMAQQIDKPCECCNKNIKVCSTGFDSWKQYCGSCFGRKGSDELDIVVAGTNQYGYKFYKTVPKKFKEPKGYAFLED